MNFNRCLPLALILLATPVLAERRGLDDGLLDPAWFGGERSFRETDEIDYLWVADGLDLNGATIRVVDFEPTDLLGEDRDSKDRAQAAQLTDNFPGWLDGAVGSVAGLSTSDAEGSYTLVGRIVDCNAGSVAAKWIIGMGAGSSTATWDLKLLDPQGEVVAAIHHRAISGTNMSEIGDKILMWLDDGLIPALEAGLGRTYASGKIAKK
jgi:hypothetical protein